MLLSKRNFPVLIDLKMVMTANTAQGPRVPMSYRPDTVPGRKLQR